MGATPIETGLDASFPASFEGLRAALEAVESFSAARNLVPDLVSRTRIIVEELFTNTIKYGYRCECDLPIRLNLSTGKVLTLVFEDDAPEFDPTTWRSIRTAPGEGQGGESGIPMVLGLAVRVNYVRLPNANRLTVTLAARAHFRC